MPTSLCASRDDSYTAPEADITGSDLDTSQKPPKPGSCIRPILRGDVFILVPCGSCDDCRTRKRLFQRDTLLGLMMDSTIYRAPKPDNWDYLRKLLAPAGHNALHCPREGAEPMVYTDHPFDGWEVVDDLEAALEESLLAIPRGTKLSTTRGWALTVHTGSLKDDSEETQNGPAYNFRGSWQDVKDAVKILKLTLTRINDSVRGYQRWKIDGLHDLDDWEWCLWVGLTGCYRVGFDDNEPFDIFTPA